MLRGPRVITLLSILMFSCSLPAKADIWDWLAELSGPGPFTSRGNVTATLYCRQSERFKKIKQEGNDLLGGKVVTFATPDDEKAARRAAGTANSEWFHLLPTTTEKGPCVYVEGRRFRTPRHYDNPRFYAVRAEVVDSGITERITPFLEVGAGVGWIHFDSGGITTDKPIFDIPRVSVKPLLLIPGLREDDRHGRHGGFAFIQFFYRTSLIGGTLTQDNFKPKPGTTFNAKNDLVPSYGFMVDPIAGIRLILDK